MKISVSELAKFYHFRHSSAGDGSLFGGAAHREFFGDERRSYAAVQAALYAYMLAVECGAPAVAACVRLLSVDGYTLHEETETYTENQLAEKFRAFLVPHVRWDRQAWAKHPQEVPLSKVRGKGLQVPKPGLEKAVLAYQLGEIAQGGKTTCSDLATHLKKSPAAVRRLLKRAGMELDNSGKERAPGFLVCCKRSLARSNPGVHPPKASLLSK